jgi:hypothetical protein
MSDLTSEFLSARDLAKIMYRLKLKALRRSNASVLVNNLQKELKALELDLQLDPTDEEIAFTIEQKTTELEVAKQQRASEPGQNFKEAEMLAEANTIFQYLLDEYMRPKQRLNDRENMDVVLRFLHEGNGDKILIIDWNDGDSENESLQAVCKEKFVTVPSDVTFERKGNTYKRANTDIYQEADELEIPKSQKIKINFARESVAPVIYPRA